MSVRGEERSRKRYAVRDDESAFTSEQQRRGVTFFGEEEQDKRADVTRRSAGRSLAVIAPTSEERSRKRCAVRDDESAFTSVYFFGTIFSAPPI